MEEIINKYKVLFGSVLITAAVCTLIYIYFIRPVSSGNDFFQGQITKKRSDLSSSKLPLDPKKLEIIHAERQRLLRKAAKQKELVEGYSHRQIMAKINNFFGDEDSITLSEFISSVQNVHYQQHYERVKASFNSYGIYWDEAANSLGLTAKTSAVSKKLRYELLLSLWTFEYVVKAAQSKGMSIGKDYKAKKVKFKYGSALPVKARVLEPRRYVLASSNKDHFLTEFPVVITLEGRISQFLNFLQLCNRKDSFLPVSHIKVEKTQDAKSYSPDWLVIEVECSFFLSLDKVIDFKKINLKNKSYKAPPPGA